MLIKFTIVHQSIDFYLPSQISDYSFINIRCHSKYGSLTSLLEHRCKQRMADAPQVLVDRTLCWSPFFFFFLNIDFFSYKQLLFDCIYCIYVIQWYIESCKMLFIWKKVDVQKKLRRAPKNLIFSNFRGRARPPEFAPGVNPYQFEPYAFDAQLSDENVHEIVDDNDLNMARLENNSWWEILTVNVYFWRFLHYTFQ